MQLFAKLLTQQSIMASFPVIQITEGEWTSEKFWDILGMKVPESFTKDPALLADYISKFETRSDDVFVVTYPKSRLFIVIVFLYRSWTDFLDNIRVYYLESLGCFSTLCWFMGRNWNFLHSQPKFFVGALRKLKSELPFLTSPPPPILRELRIKNEMSPDFSHGLNFSPCILF